MATTPTTQATDQQTHAADLKPRPPIKKIITRANPFKKNHHRSKPIQKKIITEANPFKPILKKSSPEPPKQTH